MFIDVNGIRFNYEFYKGSSREVTVLLHGWGANAEAMRGIFNYLKEQHQSVLALDFPGFGLSPPPPRYFCILEYANYTREFFKFLGIKKINIIAHSFGARVAILLAAKDILGEPEDRLVEKLLLTGAAGLKPKRGLKYYCRVFSYKVRKFFGCKNLLKGSEDYKKLNENMRPIFVRVVNQHLDAFLQGIEIPTLIVWGSKDKDTPPYMANRLHKGILDSKLVFIENAGHYAFLDKPHQFNSLVEEFLAG